jgi:serine/threonine protein kinase
VAPQTPAQLGRYQIEKEIGRGMMGVVYRAHDPALGRSVALKTVQLAFPIPDEQKESFEQRFLAEARAAAALSHPSIVVVHDVGRDSVAGTPFIALELLHGQTLADRLAGGPLPLADALRIATQLAEALHHAHGQGIVHRDIKPANIMLLDSGVAKLMDFGVAKVPASQLTAAGEFFGTPSYMSPEQALAREVDGRSDLFSLGCVLYAMLTGERAFDGPSVPTILAMIAHKSPPPPTARKGGLTPAVDAVVAHALAKEPEHRYQTGRAFAEDLQDVAQGRPPRHTPLGAAPAHDPRDQTMARGVPRNTPIPRHTPVPQPTPVPISGRTPVPAPTATPLTPPLTAPAPSRRNLVVLGAAGLIFLTLAVAFLGMSVGLRSRVLSTALPVPPPADVTFTFEHPMKTGTVRVYVDDSVELEEALESRVVQRILSVEIRKGSLEKMLYVSPGEHVIRVEVEGETFTVSRKITGVFVSGQPKRLHGEMTTLIKKELVLYWRQ